jgi:hypothetical protein
MSQSEATITVTQENPVNVPVENVATEVTQTNNTLGKEEEYEFTRENIEKMGNHIRLVDKDETNNLDLFCYVKCSPTDNQLIKDCRGVVFNNETLVMKAFPYTVEYNHTETERIEDALTRDFSEYSCFDAHEGALIRLFNFNNKWYTSTHRKLNSFRSKWASRESFGSAFKKALESEVENNELLKKSLPEGDENLLEKFQTTLDPTKQYMFLIRNTGENRIVCDAPERPLLYHVGTFVDGELVWDENINVPYPRRHYFTSLIELYGYVDSLSYRDLAGVIVFTSDNQQYKILLKEYQDLFRVRGNEPSIKFRYIQVRMNRKYTKKLCYLYPDMVSVFDDYENTIYDIALNMYRSYVQRYIKKRYVTVPREEFAVIRECHKWHLLNRTENRINQNKIIEILNQQSPTNINHMIRRFHTEQIRKKEVQEDARAGSMGKSPSLAGTTPTTMSPLIHSSLNSNSLPPLLSLSRNDDFPKDFEFNSLHTTSPVSTDN